MLNASYPGFVSTPVVVTLPGPREAFERFDGREGNAAGANVRAASLGAPMVDGGSWFIADSFRWAPRRYPSDVASPSAEVGRTARSGAS
jgi:hypothetical protein